MKTSHFFPLPLAAALSVCVSLSPLRAGNDTRPAASLPSKNEPAPAPDAATRRAQSARVLIGQDVRDAAGETLGELSDLVVDPEQGKILFALVESGGLLGVGEEVRAVPFAALRRAGDASHDLTLAISRDRWSQAPALGPDHTDALSDRNVARDVFAFYNQALDESLPAARAESPPRIVRVSELIGSEVENAGRQVGSVQDVVVHFDSRRASVLLDPVNDYSGTDREFLVNFAQLSPAGEDRLVTTLQPDDFASAPRADDRWWTTLQGYPYWWAGYNALGGPAYTGAIEDPRLERALAGGEREERRSLEEIRDRLRSDRALSAQAPLVTLEERDGRLVLEGAVPTRAAKNAIDQLVSDFATGWEVVNHLEVSRAAE